MTYKILNVESNGEESFDIVIQVDEPDILIYYNDYHLAEDGDGLIIQISRAEIVERNKETLEYERVNKYSELADELAIKILEDLISSHE